MHCHHHSATVLVAIVVGVIASTYAQAASRVGSATNVVRDVSGSLSGTSWDKKVKGDDVYENEFVRTAARSSAVISFIDETNISIGQAATMKIDRVVLKPNRSVEELIVSAEAGAMRWNSGTSPSGAYQVKTPDAIIRPVGTIFDLLVESQRTMVVLRSGTIEVCSVGAPQRCQTLSQSGDTIVATSNDLERPQRAGLGLSEFADRCLSADAMPCLITASISPAQPASPKRETQTYPAQPPTQTGETPVRPPPGTGPCYRSKGRTICGGRQPTQTGDTGPPGTGNCNLSKGRTICRGPTQTGDTGPPGTGNCYRSKGRTICGGRQPTQTGDTGSPFGGRGRTGDGRRHTGMGPTGSPFGGRGHPGIGLTGGLKAFGLHSQ